MSFRNTIPRLWWVCHCAMILGFIDCVCLSFPAYINEHKDVCCSVVPARIMMLVGASCLGLRLSINPTDGASLGSELCIWWPGGKLANGVHTYTPTQPIHTKNKKLHTWQSIGMIPQTPYIMIQNELSLFGSCWLMLTGRKQSLSLYPFVCVSFVCWSSLQREGAGCYRVTCHMFCHLLLISYTLPHMARQIDPCYSTDTFDLNSLHPLTLSTQSL